MMSIRSPRLWVVVSMAVLAPACTALVGTFEKGEAGSAGASTSTTDSASSTAVSSAASVTASSSSAVSSSSGGCDPQPKQCSFSDPQCCPAGDHCVVDYGDGGIPPNGVLVANPLCAKEGAIGPLGVCKDDGNCKGSTLCLNGECRTTCAQDSDCAGANAVCGFGEGSYDTNTGVVTPIVYLCLDDCQPFKKTSNGCPQPNGSCQLDVSALNSEWGFRCVPGGATHQGEVCQLITDCAPGLGCYFTGAQATCLTYCDLNSPVCPVGSTCKNDLKSLASTNTTPTIAGVTYGVCR